MGREQRAPELPCAFPGCGKPEWVHSSVDQGHSFTREVPGAVEELPAMPFDPVLRQALVDKGVLTPEDLQAAHDKIVRNSIIFGKEMSRGSDSRT